MCGIIGIISKNNVVPRLLDGLHRLEYRGYDSAGIATLTGGQIERRRAEGKLVNLDALLAKEPLEGLVGIGHTRWATHGLPNERNAHPHSNGRVAVVHNGIIENYMTLKASLIKDGYEFQTETDTEVVVHLITRESDQGYQPWQAFQNAIKQLEGAFALVVIFQETNAEIFAARQGSPLAIGYGEGEMFVGSDALAIGPIAREISYLGEGDMVKVTLTNAEIIDSQGKAVKRPIKKTESSGALIGKGNYKHYMQKEIYEQPIVLADTLHSYLHPSTQELVFPDLDIDWAKTDRITILACGTSYYSGYVAKYWLEQWARISVDLDIASEFRYRTPAMPKNGVVICISQSGETADTLAALRYARTQGQKILSLVNVAESTMMRESDKGLLTLAGPEIGVASTKAFTTQLMVLAALSIKIAEERKAISIAQRKELVDALTELPAKIVEVLAQDQAVAKLAEHLSHVIGILYLARGANYPIALEGALKMKELAYIHAEGYAAGEMKHGPIALIDENLPVVILSPSGPLFEKMASNMQEARARKGKIILISDAAGLKHAGSDKDLFKFEMPDVHPFASPILYTIPVQMLAYHTAVLKGTDVDQPRNLAKSVTVE